MPHLRAGLAVIAVLAACSGGEPRQGAGGDAGDEEQVAGEAGSSSSGADASAADAAADSELSEHDGAPAPPTDASRTMPADAAQSSNDAHIPADAGGTSCAVEAGLDSSCVAHLCETDGGTALALDQDEPWRIGALDWTATVCGRSLGWPAGATSDVRNVYSLTATDLQQVRAGAPVQTFYGGPMATSGLTTLDCTVELRDDTPSCRASR